MKNKLLPVLGVSALALAISGCNSSDDDQVSRPPEPNGYQFYVSPNGSDDNTGSSESPWRTLEKAQQHVRSINAGMSRDIEIILQDGTHQLDSTLELTEIDSGTNGFKIIYRAAEGASPTISGGISVSGFEDTNGDGIWTAPVPAGSRSRQLFVDGERATRARSVDGSGWLRDEPSTTQGNKRDSVNTYRAPEQYAGFAKPEELEVVSVMRWKMYRGSVSEIDGDTAYMNDKYWELARIGPFGILDSYTQVNWVENALELLDQEGEWYLDNDTDTLHYKPVEGQDLASNDTTVVLPVLEELVSINGANNITFQGLTFADATWMTPSNPEGYVSIQSGALLFDPEYDSIEDAFEGLSETPGAIQLSNSENIVFKQNTFENMGATALQIANNNKVITVFDNQFDDISSSAISIGDLQEHHVSRDELNSRIVVDNNRITNVSREYFDAVAIKLNFADRVAIVNNSIDNASSGGISTGWGWGRYDVENFGFWYDNTDKGYNAPTTLNHYLVAFNEISNIGIQTGDTGGVYNLGASPNSRWYGNLIYDVQAPAAPGGATNIHGIYPDNGTRNVEIRYNGVVNTVSDSYLANGSQKYNIVDFGSEYYFTRGDDSLDQVPVEIVEGAGYKESITDIRSFEYIDSLLPERLERDEIHEIPQQGIVVGKPAYASANEAEAVHATDGVTETFWSSGSGSGWLAVNLEEPTNIESFVVAFGEIKDGREFYHKRGDHDFIFEGKRDDNSEWEEIPLDRTWSVTEPTIPTTQAINQHYTIHTNNNVYQHVRVNVTDSPEFPVSILRFKLDKTHFDPDRTYTR